MSDELPSGDKAVYIFLEMIALGFALEAVASFMRGDVWWRWIGALVLGVLFLVAGVKWLQIKLIIAPRFVSTLERVANNRLYRSSIYAAIVLAILMSTAFRIYRHYYPLPIQPTATDTSGPIQPPTPLESLTVSPIKLVFKDQAIGTTSTPQIVTIVNRTTAPRMITQIEASGDFSQTNDCASELMVGDSCNVEVKFIPKTLGLTHGSLDISCHDVLFSSFNLFAKVDFSGGGIANIQSKVSPSKAPSANTDKAPSQKGGLELKVSIVNPNEPAIVVDNQTNDVASGITWELVMFRTTDQAFFSYATQDIGYVKAHSKGPRYGMTLNTLAQAPGGGGRIANGESFVGTIAVDCPTCKGEQLIVSFVWGQSGWFYQVPNAGAKLLLPGNPLTGKVDLSKEAVSGIIDSINAFVKPEGRTPII
jgi:hypothetical protein